jgi:hypothetical protein
MVNEYDLALQQEVGHGTVFSLSYLGGLGRELPNYVDVNLDPTTTATITTTVSDTAGKGPLPNGTQYQEKVYTKYGNSALFGTAGSGYQGIVEVLSNINSSYNALVAEVQNRTLHHLQFDANYTWSHALDFNQSATTTISGTSENWLDPYSNARTNYGNSTWNIPNRFVAYALYTLPGVKSTNWLKYLVNDWGVDDSFQMANGLPYSGLVKSAKPTTSAASTGWYGTGTGASYIPVLGRDTYAYPRHIVDDVRLSKAIAITEGRNLELMVNLFNIANHQNIDGINNTAYKFSSTGTATSSLTYQSSFGAITSSNNSSFTFTPRQVEIAAKFTF